MRNVVLFNHLMLEGILLFGPVTLRADVCILAVEVARKSNPVWAEHMDHLPKIVFSRTLATVSSNNTKLVKGNLAEELHKLKKPGEDWRLWKRRHCIATGHVLLCYEPAA